MKVFRCEKLSVMFNHYFQSSSFDHVNQPLIFINLVQFLMINRVSQFFFQFQIVTSDVDAFPMSSSLLEPLFLQNYQIWIYEVTGLRQVSQIRCNSAIFGQNCIFIAVSYTLWKQLLAVNAAEIHVTTLLPVKESLSCRTLLKF